MIFSSEQHQFHQNSSKRKPYFYVKNAQNPMSAGARPMHTPLGELTALPQNSWIKGPYF